MNAQRIQQINAQLSTFTKGWLIAAIGGVVAVLSLIMAWVSVNIGQVMPGFNVSASGFGVIGINTGAAILQLINIACLVAVIVFFVLYLKSRQLDKVSAIVVMACGAASVVLSIIVYAIAAGGSGGSASLGMAVGPGLGFFIGLAGFIAVAVGGYFNFQEFRRLHPEAFAPRPAYPQYGYPPQPGQYPQQPGQPQYPPQQGQYPPAGQYPQPGQYPPAGGIPPQQPQYPPQPGQYPPQQPQYPPAGGFPQYPQQPKEPPKP